jgi:tartrate dehydratase beta subunit/fumarate hydratase class I family protein
MAASISAASAVSRPNWRWKIEVENFPAFIITDDKGNDFFDIG